MDAEELLRRLGHPSRLVGLADWRAGREAAELAAWVVGGDPAELADRLLDRLDTTRLYFARHQLLVVLTGLTRAAPGREALAAEPRARRLVAALARETPAADTQVHWAYPRIETNLQLFEAMLPALGEGVVPLVRELVAGPCLTSNYAWDGWPFGPKLSAVRILRTDAGCADVPALWHQLWSQSEFWDVRDELALLWHELEPESGLEPVARCAIQPLVFRKDTPQRIIRAATARRRARFAQVGAPLARGLASHLMYSPPAAKAEAAATLALIGQSAVEYLVWIITRTDDDATLHYARQALRAIDRKDLASAERLRAEGSRLLSRSEVPAPDATALSPVAPPADEPD